MIKPVTTAFDLAPVALPLTKVRPARPITDAERAAARYRAVVASIKEVGVVEALVVYPDARASGTYVLLDGHVRRQALLDLGEDTALCLIAADDEAFTYSHRINRLAPIQEHRMIAKAIEAGVSEERIARALNLDVQTIRRNRSMLHGLCAEAVEILKDKPVADQALRYFKRVRPMRQIEMAELMVAAQRFTGTYAKALLVATPRDKLTDAEVARRSASGSADDLAKMQQEMQALERDTLVLDESYGHNVVHLTLARGHLKGLLDNGKVVRFLAQKHGDLLKAFQQIADATSLDA